MDCVGFIRQKRIEMKGTPFKYWIKAARPKTLLVSMAPVIMTVALVSVFVKINWLPAIICLVFAVMAQIISNFVNDYSDGVKGIDENRIGPERMVASGLISPQKMRRGIMTMCAVTFVLGCSLMYWGGLILLPFGIVIMLCALAYSMGPFPLSQHALGDMAVVLFYGIAPVVLTFFIQTGCINWQIFIAGLAIGMVINNLLIVNNYRDADEDLKNGKKTTVNVFGKHFMKAVYFTNPLIAIVLSFVFLDKIINPIILIFAMMPFLAYSTIVSVKFDKAKDMELNKLIGMSSLEAIVFALTITFVVIFK